MCKILQWIFNFFSFALQKVIHFAAALGLNQMESIEKYLNCSFSFHYNSNNFITLILKVITLALITAKHRINCKLLLNIFVHHFRVNIANERSWHSATI